jgi:hypothetical protein
MLNLTFIDGAVETAVVISSPFFRITGGTIHELDEGRPLAMFVAGGWKYGPMVFAGVRFAGSCQLVAGITRDLHPLCGPLKTLALDGPILLANSVPFARYDPDREMWDNLLRPSSWRALRIVSANWLGSGTAEPRGSAMTA